MRAATLIVAFVLGPALLLGCEESIEPDPAPAPAASEGQDYRPPPRSGNTALGGAKRAADNTVNSLEQRQQDLIKEMEDDQ
jgi:hypothetical protein